MTALFAATEGDAAIAFIEIGALALGLAAVAFVASRLGITAVPFYLIAGLGLGEGGIVTLDVSEDFVSIGADIGVLLLLFTLGLEYSTAELSHGLRTGLKPGGTDAVLNFLPGFIVGVLLGWSSTAAILLGGVTWISSSGVVSKVLSDLNRLGNRETPAVLNLLVIEDLAMAVYLPVVAALVAGESVGATIVTVTIALVTVGVVIWLTGLLGDRMSARLDRSNDEVLLLGVFGATLLVGGLAEQLSISSAVGAFLTGLALSGPVQHRAQTLVAPLRDLFAAIFFLFFSFRIDPADLPAALIPAIALAVVSLGTKLVSGWVAAGQIGAGVKGRFRAGCALMARGEFSIVIASLGATLADGDELGAVAAAYVLITAVVGPLAAKQSDSLVPKRLLARVG